MTASQRELNGDHWSKWLSVPIPPRSIPALLIHGLSSRQLPTEHADEMADRRPDTRFVHLDGGHDVCKDGPTGYTAALSIFLAEMRHQVVRTGGP